MSYSRLAKLTRPRLHGAAPRERLFRLLDEKREHPVVWITGPPGSGKTTLIAGYLEEGSPHSIWYLLDSGDSDPATFFYYLSQAVAGTSRSRRRRLPALTAECLSDLDGFSRRYMREMFTMVRDETILVVDNYHDLAPSSPLHRMLNAAIAEIPRSANLIVISRGDPPPVYSRARVAGEIGLLGWDDLRLQRSETASVLATGKPLAPGLVDAIHTRCGGWVAGARLLLEHAGQDTRAEELSRLEMLEPAFEYFAAEIFDGAPDPIRSLLLRTSFLPRFTIAMAAEIADEPDAAQWIEQMYRRRLFIDRRSGGVTTYQYHDLFRAFLQSRAARLLPQEAVATLAGRSARLLLSAGLSEEAWSLSVQAGDWDLAEAILLAQAELLLAHGRWQTLENWAIQIPAVRLEANPWLKYWTGRAKALTQAGEGLALVEAAYAAFRDRNDNDGQLQCAAAIVEAIHFVIHDWDRMSLWTQRLEECLQHSHRPLAPSDELRIHAALFWASENSLQPSIRTIRHSVGKVVERLADCEDVNLRVSVANILQYHAGRDMDLGVSRMATSAVRTALQSPELSPDRKALYYLAEGMSKVDACQYEEALSCYSKADALIATNNLPGRPRIAAAWRAMCLVAKGDLPAAKEILARTDSTDALPSPVIEQVLSTASAWVAFGSGRLEQALKHCVDSTRLVEQAGVSVCLGFVLPNHAYMLVAAGKAHDALKPLERIRSEPWLPGYGRFSGAVSLLEAWHALRTSDPDRCRRSLTLALELAQHEPEYLRMRWYPLAIADLVPFAIENGIRPETARMLVRRLGLVPPSASSLYWPWPIEVRVLGKFEILAEGKRVEFGRKAPKRTLALLKAIIAFGGSEVPEHKLMDALWPDEEADAAAESLSAALHRLRRILGNNDTIRQSGGLLSLNPLRIYVDSLLFDQLLKQPGQEGQAISLYAGNAEMGEMAPWAVSFRERLRSKFIRAVESVARNLESACRYEEAASLYARGIETDELVEAFYRGMMRSYRGLGRTAEAASVYRRLRRTLSITLGTHPAAETQKLFAELRIP